MNILLLPGMDGTGSLFEPFVACVPGGYKVTPLSLRQEPCLSYADQAAHALSRIGDDDTIIVAESYSGRIAYEIAQKQISNIRHIVFAASFLTKPSALARIAPLLPPQLLKSGLVPSPIIGKLAFGRASTRALTDRLKESLGKVDNAVLRHRLRQVSTLQVPGQKIDIPCTYIRPKDDKLVSPRAAEFFKSVCPDLAIREVEGSHFVLQSNPRECWEVIQKVAQPLIAGG
ncbi:alpha/beta fold hydrolase [Microbulbifer halophilus]|uniref:Alpha/beta fold hydrolase n=1 Tax=Microbulbifer halophilus TaxID=453963 RepID=A0ABW5EJB3_9GAMM|nr:alpha/beta fold hydrolase [Microbulbifer halophilus]MCW8128242.1 hypothetical protein [Microbulbifer halophilus]